jgi:CPA1 family monovalent cation:H+ antiporter
MIIRKKIAQYSLQFLKEKYGKEQALNQHLNNLMGKLEIDSYFFNQVLEESKSISGNSLASYQGIYLKLLEEQRRWLHELNHREEFDEDLIRKYLSLIDLEEFKLREQLLEEINSK